MSADPTAEHIDAVARALSLDPGAFSESTYGAGGARVMASRFAAIDRARKLLASTDPAVHAALAASLPAEVMQIEREAGAANALWNQANLVGQAIDQGRLDGTNGSAVAAAIRARTPEEFAKACGEVAP